MSKAALVLADGSVFEGESLGAELDSYGEVVFDTSMAGYQEMLTDPSFAGQILVFTYPLIGNYGVNETDSESSRIWAQGTVVRESCDLPSHYRSLGTLHQFLLERGIPGISGVDTRAITRKLRSSGVMMGMITSSKTPQEALRELRQMPSYDAVDFVRQVTIREPGEWPDSVSDGALHVVIVDLGVKSSILRLLSRKGCRVSVVPAFSSAQDILRLGPDGILFSPGPGNPDLLDQYVGLVKGLIDHKPVMGICLGHQVLARAFGARNFKLKFGHRGGNHPVRELATGRVYITAQNHGYALDPETLGSLEVTHINLNDGTVEGLKHRDYPLISIQYHAEATPGPEDSVYMFDAFIAMMQECR